MRRNIESRVRKSKALKTYVLNQLSGFATNDEQLFEPRGDDFCSFNRLVSAGQISQLAIRFIEKPFAGCVEQLRRIFDKISRMSLEVRNCEDILVGAYIVGEFIA